MRVSISSLANRATRIRVYACKLSVRPSVLLRFRFVICSMRTESSDFQASSGISTSSLLRMSSIELALQANG